MAGNDPKMPALGSNVPRRGNGLTRALGRIILRLIGWDLDGTIPDKPKMVAVMAPHTSNWDFVLGMLFMFAIGVRFSWLGKHNLFQGPLGSIMRWLGGVPVRRDAPVGVVDQAIAAFAERDQLILAVTPEGTRRATTRWKTGFYRIAAGAGVPLLLATLDYGRKTAMLGPLIEPTGDQEADVEHIKGILRQVQGRHPHTF